MDHNPAQEINPHIPAAARWIGATPLVVFLAVYLLTSLILRDFYAMPITVAFLVSSVYAVAITRGLSTEKRVLRFSRGVADYNLLMMIWIFVLAGAFSEAANSIGAIDATVHLILRLLPAGLLLPGLFLASCVISLSIGTSVGTVVALVPIALGLSEPLGLPVEYIAAVVTGGAFFGDNLSFISDTPIGSTSASSCPRPSPPSSSTPSKVPTWPRRRSAPTPIRPGWPSPTSSCSSLPPAASTWPPS